MDVQLNDTDGRPSDKATVEEWWGGEKLDKRVYTTAKGTTTYLRKGGKSYRNAGYEYPGYFLEKLSDEVVAPIPSLEPVDQVSGKMESFGKVKLDCLQIDFSGAQIVSQSKPSTAPRLPTRFCLSADNDALRAILGTDGVDFLRNTVGKFQNRQVAADVIARAGNITRATAHVDSLNSKPLPPDVFSTDGLVEQSSEPVGVPAGVMAGKTLSKQEPRYPVAAKQQHIQGTVFLHGHIGKDGHIQSLEVLSQSQPAAQRCGT